MAGVWTWALHELGCWRRGRGSADASYGANAGPGTPYVRGWIRRHGGGSLVTDWRYGFIGFEFGY